MKPLILGLALLCAVPVVQAGPYAPSGRFLAAVKPAAPVLPYKLGLIKAEGGTAANGYAEQFTGFYADLRTTLAGSGLLDSAAAERVRLDYKVETFAFNLDSANHRGLLDLVIVYRFHRDGQTLAEHRVRSHGRADGYDSYEGLPVQRALESNLHLLMVQMRAHGDATFAAQAAEMTARIDEDSRNPMRTIGGLLTDGFMATAEGTVAVVGGLAEVGGVMLEVAASPEFAATLDQEMANQRAQQAQQQAYYNELQRQAAEQQARQQAQQQARQPAAQQTPRQQAAAAAPQPAPAQNPGIRPYTPVQNGASGTGSWASAGGRSSNGAASSAPRGDNSGSSSSRLQATPEAIFVCTRPGADGRFECDSPVTAGIDGGPKSLSQWRTPDSMLASMSAACPSPRRLQSTTHLVWGCGFGATNNSNSMDRSAGVDVQGRATYYCYPKQTSCRQTSP